MSGLGWQALRQQGAGGHLRKQKAQRAVFALSILVPLIASFAIFWIYPVIRGFLGSFTAWRGFEPRAEFVGLHQYARAFRDPVFTISLRNTFYYALLTVPLDIVLALSLALAVQASGAVKGYLRAAYFLPVVTSTIATALVWKWLYQPSFGLINQLLELAHLPTQRWLISTRMAMPSIAIYAIWKSLGFNMVIFAAGLTTISETYYDAAKVDGANHWQVFRRVTLPLLQPTLTFVVITAVIGSLQVFGPVYVMSGDPPGGPNNSTMVVAVLQWTTAFRDLELGYGSAMGLVLFFIILALTLVQLRVLRTRWEY